MPPTELSVYRLSPPSSSLPCHRSRLPLAPQVEKTSPPRPQDSSTGSVSTIRRALSVSHQVLILVACQPLSSIRLDVHHFPSLLFNLPNHQPIARIRHFPAPCPSRPSIPLHSPHLDQKSQKTRSRHHQSTLPTSFPATESRRITTTPVTPPRSQSKSRVHTPQVRISNPR